MRPISVRFLGGFEVRFGDRMIVSFEYEKLRVLLAYLLMEPPAPHSREIVAELFWPDESPDAARHSLRQALLKLRQVLEDEQSETPLILSTRTTIQRNPNAVLLSDVEKFEECMKSFPETERLEQAASLYGGELLHGLSFPDGPAFEEWLLPKREKYRRMAITLFDCLAECYETKGNYQTACRYAQQLISLEPWSEEAHRRLMLLLARTGQRAAALKEYEECRIYLQKFLGIAPTFETERMHNRIRDAGSARFDLPRDVTPFFGRQQELATLLRFLSARANRIITITGLGGMGKTRLAIRAGILAANERARMFLHGIYFVPLIGIFTANQLQSAVAKSLGVSMSSDENQETQLLRFLKEKELLLILDNFENLINDTNLTFLIRITDSAPSVQILLTSREKLNLRSEQILPVGGLSFPDSYDGPFIGKRPGRYASVRLFIGRMKSLQPLAQSRDMRSIFRICAMLEGMPLAIELAAAWSNTLSPSEIASGIRRNLDLLQVDSPDLAPRHRSVRAAFEGSWLRLNAKERRAMADLSVFPTRFTREAFEAVTQQNVTLLSRLIALSLVQSSAPSDRYHVHELLRQFCSEKSSRVMNARARNRHCLHFCSLLGTLENELRCAGEEAVLKKMEADFENISTAWQWAASKKKAKSLGQMAAMLHHFYTRRGRYPEGLEAFSAAQSALKNYPGSTSRLTMARLLAFQADLYRETGQNEKAKTGFQRSLSILRKVAAKNSERELAFVFWKIGLLIPEAEKAGRFLERSLTIYQAIGDQQRSAAVLTSLGLWRKSLGDLQRSKACLEGSLAILRNFNSPEPTAEACYHLAGLLLRQGQYESSESLFAEGIELARKSNHPGRIANGLFLLSQCYFYTGKFELMENLLRESIELQKRLGQQSQIALSTAFLALGLMHLGRYGHAERTCDEALTSAMETNFAPASGVALAVLACLQLAEGSYANAHELACQAMNAYEMGWQEDWRARRAAVQAFGACAQCLLGQTSIARMELAQALHTAFEVHSMIALMSCLPVAALLLSKEGQIQKAVEVYALAETQAHVSKSLWFSDVIGSQIMKATSQFPAGQFSPARVHHQSDDFWIKSDLVCKSFQL